MKAVIKNENLVNQYKEIANQLYFTHPKLGVCL
ncbi:Uncharacterised protein [Salmonella enterica subsp. arizonae]|uniref:Uncharacterized protein n=1 Tax=Salmonella enterica subsp. arizonae TaxID=59203 RepID=A0A379T1V0_SALER|nr:Uncharacterised protein [Salmonella enterica subsp. arizonae]